MATISELFVYPIKSCAGIALHEARLLATGLEYDRCWMVTDPAGAMLTQRAYPRMALIKVEIGAEDLVIRAPGMSELRTPLNAARLDAAPAIQTKVWRDAAYGLDTGAASAAWFSAFLGVPARLLRFDPGHERIVDPGYTDSVGGATTYFADGFPLLVIGQASLDDLNTRLNGKGAPAIPIDRFRPNVVLTGLDAYEEDYVETLSVDGDAGENVQLQLVKPCSRCPMPTIDQAKGAPDPDWPNEPTDTMSVYRANPQRDGAITFGNNALVASGAGQWLRVGQSVEAELGFGD
ncbi:putative Fe-S protein [Burkholderia sp. Ch1-1]|uniref:Putative Fe-S protein n=1 Tax=Paraburkholderia dioscoreae TaxID=2604047 RepID=A0A5Q4YVD1_9BURK|nr:MULTISPECIES: MOSC N-terminal beta barrel domain-containing protein [Paraburkholderia]EIF31232.1 putative Fe-S protein [Burkholderia sp. Ch1-1]MDR8399603.1 MOSC N-terminal beta barrel domain-containing protein [Paraburkholderia sp. USG1]VVD28564.1 putative Fe-S protein [Paraburkholderia dioscoreae]